MSGQLPESGKTQHKLISRYTWFGVAMGFSSVILGNMFLKKFWYQGIHRHFIGVVAGGAAGTYFNHISNRAYARRDFIIDDYKARHPEYFDDGPAPLVGEIFIKWAPIR